MHELESTWGRAIAVWWLMFWRGTVGAFLLGLVAGFIIGLTGTLLGRFLNLQLAPATAWLSGGVGAIAGVFWFMFVVRMAQSPTFCIPFSFCDDRVSLAPVVRSELASVTIPPRQGIDVHLHA